MDRYTMQAIKQIVHNAHHVVFFGGAGVSTDSGIPDFRGNGGLYTGKAGAEYLLSVTCLLQEPQLFFDFYRKSMVYPDARPNAAHLALAKLERQGKLKAVITQNIDGLHQLAGSRTVYELHGTTTRCYCARCGKLYSGNTAMQMGDIPRCTVCGGTVRPDVVLYGEGLDAAVFTAAQQAVCQADVLIVGGTSLTVQPAASLLADFNGQHMIIVNRTPTPYDDCAEYVIRDGLSEFFTALVDN